MHRNCLYSQLLGSLYALDGRAGEFLGDLARPIQLSRDALARRADVEIPLALFPSLYETPDLVDLSDVLERLGSALG